jgi:hypothetical protein
MGAACEPYKKQCLFGNGGALARRVLSFGVTGLRAVGLERQSRKFGDQKVSLLSLYWLPNPYRNFRSLCAVPFLFIFFTIPSVVI